MRLLFIIVFFSALFFGVQTSYGQFTQEQKNEIENFNAIINSPNSHDTSVAQSYLGLSEILYISKLDTIIFLCEKVEKIASKGLKENPIPSIKRAFKTVLAGAYNNIGYVNKLSGNISEALNYHQKSLNIKKEIGDKKGLATSYNNIGIIYKGQGDIPLALDYYHKGLKLEEEIGNQKGMATSYNNIGVIHNGQEDYELALEYYQKSLKLNTEIGNQKGVALSYNNIGMIYSKQAEKLDPCTLKDSLLNLTLEYCHKSLEIRILTGDKKGIAYSYTNLGGIYNSQEKLSLALVYLNKSLEIRKQIGHKKGMSNTLSSIGNLYFKKGDYKKALISANQGLAIGKELGYPDLIRRNAKLLNKIYVKKGDYKQALEMRNLEIQMKDSLNNEISLKATIKQQEKYNYDKQNALSELMHQNEMDKQHTVDQQENERQKIITYFAIAVAALILIFLIFVFNRLKITRVQKEQIVETNEELNQTNEELAAQRDEIETQKNLVENKNQEITDSISYAKRIQQAILPSDQTVNKLLPNSFVLYKPKDIIAGDFYWVEEINDLVMFAVADCTGHGVPGAMVSVVCHTAMNRVIREFKCVNPEEILNKTREIVVSRFAQGENEISDGMDIALCVWNKKLNKFHYSGAYSPLWIIRENNLLEFKADKQPIGKFLSNEKPFTLNEIELQKNDTIYLFTDGYADQFGGPKGKKLGYKKFKEKLLEISNQEMSQQKKLISNYFDEWQNNEEQVDDVCVMGVKI